MRTIKFLSILRKSKVVNEMIKQKFISPLTAVNKMSSDWLIILKSYWLYH